MTNPFAKLAALRDALPAGEAAPTPVAAPAAEPDPMKALLTGRAVVRRERKGRGGKTVTMIEWPDGAEAAALDALAKALRKALGTAAQREDTAVAVQGDIADRVAEWLAAQGASRIVRGG